MTKYRIVKEDSGMYHLEYRDFYIWFKLSGKYNNLEDAKSVINTLHANEPQRGKVVYEDK